MAHVLLQPAMAHDSFFFQPDLAHVNCLEASDGSFLHSAMGGCILGTPSMSQKLHVLAMTDAVA